MAEITQTISEIPTPPSSTDPATFDERADAFLAALSGLDDELNTYATQANAVAVDANSAKDDAESAQTAAEAAQSSAEGAQSSAEDARDTAQSAAAAAQSAAGLPAIAGNAGKSLRVNAAANGVDWEGGADVQLFTSSGTWTKPAGATTVIVELLGAGAGGAETSYLSTTFGGGGGGGQYVKHVIPASELGSTETVTVGAGGAGRGNTAVNAAGGDSSFAGFVAKGGGNVTGTNGNEGGGYGVMEQSTAVLTIAPSGIGSAVVDVDTIDGGGCGSREDTDAGGNSYLGGPGGGAGADNLATNLPGTAGGAVLGAGGTLVAGGAGGNASTSPNGANGAAAPAGHLAGSGGGGGGIGSSTAFLGNGGNGGPGAGGGGCARPPSGNASDYGKKGGDGGDGRVRITTF